jgi:hypothetical protein
MARLSTGLGFVVLVVLLALGGWAVVEGIEHDPALVGSLVTGLFGLLAAIAQRHWEKKQELERLHRAEMAPIYEELVDRLKRNPEEQAAAEAENAEFFKRVTTNLIIHGSTNVIKAWLLWVRRGPSTDPEDLTMMLGYEDILKAIRADLGHNDAGLAPGDLLRLYVNDIDEGLAKWNARQAELRRGVSQRRT